MTESRQYPVHGAGLGLRRSMMGESLTTEQVDFLEVAPENWIGVGGRYGRWLRSFTERFPFVTHGLSLSIGSPAPLDEELVKSIKQFIREHDIRCYSEHLSYCSDHGHLYDLLPIPFTEEAVHYVAGRIRRVQDILEQRIAMENVSYYAAPGQEMSELEFLNAVLQEADCDLLLDVNNIYVNAINHCYDAEAFLLGLPAQRIRYAHVAGHFDEAEDLKVDTHGAPVIDPVWQLLQRAYETYGPVPTLLERDFNIPPLPELCTEVARIRDYQVSATAQASATGSVPECAQSAAEVVHGR
ncbi:HvfB family MNIO-type RiPP peptide maturase [Microbulbifer sp. MCCC 1A16149]|uniref:HvfB family MNIO-type RiPP peptide maturase n=1 Tax=Microbulbifer sp. MCCC 1A16149 TaxID=3411322 RepID=UPI003D116830